MPKRTVSTMFSCPSCWTAFDLETHLPLVGSCGHSLCGICVNEKKPEACPACHNMGSFTTAPRNELAIEFLSAAAESDLKDSKKPKITGGEYASDEPIPAILDPDITTCPLCNTEGVFAMKKKNDLAAELLGAMAKIHESLVPAILDPKYRAFLPLVVNQLKPLDLIELASTCKSLHNYCLRSEEVKVDYGLHWLCVTVKDHKLMFELAEKEWEPHYDDCVEYLSVDYAGCYHKFLSSVVNRKKLKNYPFVFRLRIVGVVDARLLTLLRSFLAEFPIKSISEVNSEVVHDWNGFAQFLKDFKVRNVKIERPRSYYGYIYPITEEAENYLLHETRTVSIDASVSDKFILSASVPNLNLQTALI